MALHVLRERALPTATLRSKTLTAVMARRARIMVVMAGEHEHLGPLPPADRIIRWTIEDPLGWPRDVYEDVLDEIEQRVQQLAVEWRSVRLEAVASGLELPLITA